MHPRDFFDNFWAPNLRDEVFVAMSFEPAQEIVWNEIIRPAIKSEKLHPNRVDTSQISGNIMSQIMSGIAEARLVVGDLTGALSHLHDPSRRSPSGNVMYEIGLAHALRQESEVLLIAAEGSCIPFDISVARVQFYCPDALGESCRMVAHWIRTALVEVDMRKHLKVESAVRAMDRGCLRFLKCYCSEDRFPKQTFAEKESQIIATLPLETQPALIEAERRNFELREGAWFEWDKGHAVIHRLFDFGIIASVGDGNADNRFFAWTPFGRAVLSKLGLRN